MKIEENFKDLYEQIRQIADTRIDLFKLDLVEKLSRLIYLIILFLVILIIVSIIMVFLSLTGASFFGNITGSSTLGYLIITGAYLFLFILLLTNRKKWLLNPILRQIAAVFFQNSDNNENA